MKRINLWPWAFVLAVVSAVGLMQQLDTAAQSDYDSLAAQERRMWMQAVAHCHRAFGPQTAPEYDEADRLICVGKRGQRLAGIDSKAPKVASK